MGNIPGSRLKGGGWALGQPSRVGYLFCVPCVPIKLCTRATSHSPVVSTTRGSCATSSLRNPFASAPGRGRGGRFEQSEVQTAGAIATAAAITAATVAALGAIQQAETALDARRAELIERQTPLRRPRRKVGARAIPSIIRPRSTVRKGTGGLFLERPVRRGPSKRRGAPKLKRRKNGTFLPRGRKPGKRAKPKKRAKARRRPVDRIGFF